MCRRLILMFAVLVFFPLAGQAQVGDSLWARNFGPTGVSGVVKVLVQWGDSLVVGGEISGLGSGSTTAREFAIFDLVDRSWHATQYGPSGSNAEVRAAAVLPNGDLVLGGDFNFARNGKTMTHLAVLGKDGTWSTLSGDSTDLFDGPVNALLEHDGRLYIGGEFFIVGEPGSTLPTPGFTVWDPEQGFLTSINGVLGGRYSSSGSPIVHALEWVTNPGDHIYIGGDFRSAGSEEANCMARLNVATLDLTGLADFGIDGVVYALARPYVQSFYFDELYIGGVFNFAGGMPARNVVMYDHSEDTWEPLGEGVNGAVYSIRQPSNQIGNMYFGGTFDSAGTLATGSLAKWIYSNSTWSDIGFPIAGDVYSIGPVDNRDFEFRMPVGGDFDIVGDSLLFNNVFQWKLNASPDDSVLFSLGDGLFRSNYSAGSVGGVAADSAGNFYAAGLFKYAGGITVNNIGKWDGKRWSALGGGLGDSPAALAVTGDTVYAAGNFSMASGVPADRIAMWDGSQWKAMGSGLPGAGVQAIAVDTLGNLYVVGSSFFTAGGVPVTGMAMWNGSQWSAVGGPITSSATLIIFDLYIDSLTNNVYICGQFDAVDGVPCSGAAMWDGSAWTALGRSNLRDFGQPRAIERSPEGDLIIAGTFDRPEFVRQNADGLWVAYATGALSGYATDLLTVGCHVFITGDPMQYVGQNPAVQVHNLARWDGLEWVDVGGGTNFNISAMASHGAQLAIGGNFTLVNGLPTHGFTIWSGLKSGAEVGGFSLQLPAANDTLIYGNVFPITWDTNTTAELAAIEVSYDSGMTWSIIHNRAIANRGKLTWLIPDTNAAFCKIRISDGDAPCTVAEEDYFFSITADPALDVDWLQRAGGTYYNEPFTIGFHNWSFGNSKGNIWPDSVWKGIDYSGFPEPPDTVKNFPDWFTFCEAFGDDYCYRGGNPNRIRPKILEYWGTKRGKWGGSCYGFTQTALLRFKYSSWNLGFFLPWDDLYFEELNDFYRKVINKYWIYQWGEKFNEFEAEGWRLGPVASMQKIRDGFFASYPRGLSFFFRKWEMKKVNDTLVVPPDSTWVVKGHSVVPYRIFELPDTAGIYYMYVYDNNAPNDTNRVVRIDSINNRWRFQEYYSTDTAIGLMPDPNLLEYEGHASDDPLGAFRRPRAGGMTTVHTSAHENIVLTNGMGERVGWLNDELLLEDSLSVPLIPRDPDNTYQFPSGFYVPDDTYAVELSGFTDTTTRILFDRDTIAYSYARSDAAPNQNDRLIAGPGLAVVNPDATPKTASLTAIVTTATAERLIRVTGMTFAQDDSTEVTIDSAGAVTIWNTGSAKNYSLILWNSDDALGQDEITQSLTPIAIGANSTQRIEPPWGTLDANPAVLLTDSDQDGLFEDTAVVDVVTDVDDGNSAALPGSYELAQNYPNPFNPSTTIEFSLPVAGHVRLEVINILGQQVSTLVDKTVVSGKYSVEWDGRNEAGKAVASGVYFYRLVTKDFVKSRKMLLLK